MTADMRAVGLIEDVLSGLVRTREEFRLRANEIDADDGSELASTLHQIGHFIDDADVRERDAVYAEVQVQEMKELLLRLRSHHP